MLLRQRVRLGAGLMGAQAEVFHCQPGSCKRGDLGMVVGRRHLDNIQADHGQPAETTDDAGQLTGGEAADFGCPGSGSKGTPRITRHDVPSAGEVGEDPLGESLELIVSDKWVDG